MVAVRGYLALLNKDVLTLIENRAVKLTYPVRDIAAGTVGTIVSVYASGDACEVEIQEPRHALATVTSDGLEPA